MKKAVFLFACILVLAGCAYNSGVIPMGPDTYMLSKQGGGAWTPANKLLANAMQEANEYCDSMQKKLMPVQTRVQPAGIGVFPAAELQFMCLTEGDYELRRPKPGLQPGYIQKNIIDLNVNDTTK